LCVVRKKVGIGNIDILQGQAVRVNLYLVLGIGGF